jgi:hypothetical protein
VISGRELPIVPPKQWRNWNKKLAALISSFHFPVSSAASGLTTGGFLAVFSL